MKFKLTLAALIIAPIMLTACAKKEEAKNAEQQEQTTSVTQTSPEQQAAIDAIDKPNLDENHTDVTEQGAASEVAVSEVQ
ncbi:MULTISPECIES: hypothetical protein [Acinetobacter]|uniref:Lipoprotein n=1 Tax=Acinetobacter thutiue TaxID=2998078 RepID=A0ABT7WLB5_9GAMM|nr:MULTISPECIES: hypothetical protein [Acinetobacter]MCY6411379.1 hypothetical protein [Acinetobacter thutiue]MDH0029984.1 hypothetical protein [Acinetobacter sp. GD04021]MDH0885185.1 hypothetical protein [Acinetobacter sp. GD03873]MDH1082172.1 hypothetical protein [Acinetobacter sp. GD03983]MDH2188375.1 hypothetical protein [Acinetobacter sp. GD03645]